MKKNTKHNGGLTSGIVAGILAAGAAGYFLFGPNGKKNRNKVHEWMMDAKADIVSQAKKIKAATKEEFGDAIDSVTDAYIETKKITVKEAKDLKKELLSNWDTLAVMLLNGNYEKAQDFVTGKAKTSGKKVVKKATTKAAPKKKPAAKKKVVKKTTVKKATKKKK